MKLLRNSLSVCSLAVMASTALARGTNDDLMEMSLEELLNVEVSSVSKTAQSVQDTPASAYVITADDIRRSGARTIPDIVKLAPGVDVTRLNNGTQAVSIRGFHGRFANKMLVLIDGRSVYSPLYAGVFWDAATTIIEDIDRVEIIRGPGAAIWGPNATNGVINIITKTGEEGIGNLAVADLSAEGDYRVAGRTGFALGDDTSLRLFASRELNTPLAVTTRSELRSVGADEDFIRDHAGFRLDTRPTAKDEVMLSAAITTNQFYQTVLSPPNPYDPSQAYVADSDATEWNVFGTWNRTLTEHLILRMAATHGRSERYESGGQFTNTTTDLSADLFAVLDGGHEITGGFYLKTDDSMVENSRGVAFDPASRKTTNYGAILQSSWNLADGRFLLSVGSTFEENDVSGFEIQPSLRGLWRVSPSANLWGGVSRSVRTPSRVDTDLGIYLYRIEPFDPEYMSPLPIVVFVGTGDDISTEDLTTFEVGYRQMMSDKLSLDLTAFYNKYDNLAMTVQAEPFIEIYDGSPIYIVPTLNANAAEAEGRGAEIAINLLMSDRWRLRTQYSYLDLDVDAPIRLADVNAVPGDGQTAKHKFALESFATVTENVTFDTRIAYRSSTDGKDLPVDGFWDVSARLGWQPTDGLEISLLGQQLNDDERLETESVYETGPPSIAERRVFLKAAVRF
ncbi:TonB-dependent receptor plug domain-containing protein [Parvularcula sp. LCG005]|uniref:TonB-dependent receptor plug domain-containing protein n=1 Tax=Parvularcula sp. LCG005 TaxID=3078805 RepID=UPI002941CD89|nr:TonB-dependent receptor [Parvularcula sp. LCG005]WOI52509.1 TonB-dependent receptor [Parvularcula sp. LCG005]